MGRKETERTTLKFYQNGRIYKRNMKNHFDNSTAESIENFKKVKLILKHLKIDRQRLNGEGICLTKNVNHMIKKWEKIKSDPVQLEAKRQRQRDYFKKNLKKN